MATCLVPTALGLTACDVGGGSTGGTGGTETGGTTGTLTTAQKNQAFTKLKTFATVDVLNADAVKNQFTEDMSMTFNLDDCGFTGPVLAGLQAGMQGFDEKQTVRTYTGFTSTGEGYQVREMKENTDQDFKFSNGKYVKKLSDKYVLYSHNTGTHNDEPVDYKYAYYVGSDYASHEFGYEPEGFDVSSLFGTATTLEELDTNLKNYFTPENMNFTGEGGLTISVPSNNVTTTIDLVYENNQYVLKVVAVVTDFAMNMSGDAMQIPMDISTQLDISAEAEFTFTDTELKTSDFDLDMTMDMTIPSADMASAMGMPTTGLADDNKITGSMIMNMEMSDDFTVTYDTTKFPTDLATAYYEDESEITNNTSILSLIYGNEEINYFPITYDATANFETFLSDFDTTHGTVKLYLDKDCTIEANATNMAKYPSYDIDLYAKYTPAANYSVVNIVVEEARTYGYTDETYYITTALQGAEFDFTDMCSVEGYSLSSISVNGVEKTTITDADKKIASVSNTVPVYNIVIALDEIPEE